MYRYFFSLIIIFSLFLASPLFAETPINSGFIPGQIWYSKETLIEGETVNIHTAVWNGDKDSVSVNVEFYDKNVILGSRDIVLSALELKDIYVSWKITSGDHFISAKIISSIVTVSGKKEKVLLKRSSTFVDKQFVSVVVKNNIGEPVNETDLLKNQINKTTSEIKSFVPDKVSTPIVNGFSGLDSLRGKTLEQIDIIKDATKKEIGKVLGTSTVKSQDTVKTTNIQDAVKKPIAYIKLFIFSLFSFILSSQIIFYGVLVLITFLIIRTIYRRT